MVGEYLDEWLETGTLGAEGWLVRYLRDSRERLHQATTRCGEPTAGAHAPGGQGVLRRAGHERAEARWEGWPPRPFTTFIGPCAARSRTPCATDCSPVTPPSARTRCRSPPSRRPGRPSSLAEFLERVAADRLYAIWRLAAFTGVRCGELIGLRWRDVDLDAGRVFVVQQRAEDDGTVNPRRLKGGRGRSITLDPKTVETSASTSSRNSRRSGSSARRTPSTAWSLPRGRQAAAPRLGHQAFQPARA